MWTGGVTYGSDGVGYVKVAVGSGLQWGSFGAGGGSVR